MPYNTRRKSLSLPSLGIQLPQTNASRAAAAAANRSPPTTEQPPAKRAKRSHSSPSPPAPPTKKNERPRSSHAFHHTPPPSPEPSSLPNTIDLEGISDEIVVGVIQQLEKTGNKPHLVKELAAVLCASLTVVDKYNSLVLPGLVHANLDRGSSANPQAIISSRLSNYMKRPWTALSPCPLAKELLPSHPRRVYFYLTNTPHQPLPETDGPSPLNSRRSIVSPSISDEEESRKRMVLSPSPEVDLSTPELEPEADEDHEPPTPAGTFSGRSSLARDTGHGSRGLAPNPHRAVSPPLEGDEREFTQTASLMHARSISQANSPSSEESPVQMVTAYAEDAMTPSDANETEDTASLRNREAAAALFGQGSHLPSNLLSSPALKAVAPPEPSPSFVARRQFEEMAIDTKAVETTSVLGGDFAGDYEGWANEVLSPENINLDQLDDLFGDF